MTDSASDFAAQLRHRIDTKTKPLGSLGHLETLAEQIATIQQTLTPTLSQPTILVFAADHGIAAEGVSAFPSEVTGQMVANFLAGGAAISVLARQHGIELQVIDAGVASDLSGLHGLVDRKIAPGTTNMLSGPAMTTSQAEAAIQAGRRLVDDLQTNGTNVVGFGEMGIGNSSAAAMVMALMLELPVADCVGAGTGLAGDRLAHKSAILTRVQARAESDISGKPSDQPNLVLQHCGGFEIAMMAGAMLQATRHNMVLLVDGFITTAALLIARAMDESVLACSVFSHRSGERGHAVMLKHLGAKPLLDMGLRLGEGSGAALAYPLLVSAVGMLNEMASFEDARVSNKD
ncbi:MAG: nicotinate-nucleotide--dimethylbenzimidazole phosphoribosyltransferase [Chromatiales bacterium]|jgi:nicotinate-nucleotide--dimethylbenzimidazole phosphoribosyltransferase|nr:nicotinate-nucleotide--dimethylbenzimidazole phosphoribosyltransferase [Chromatiales bacterium]